MTTDDKMICPRCKSTEVDATSQPRWGFTEFTYEKWQTYFCANCHAPFSIIIEKVNKDPSFPEYVAPDGSIIARAVNPKDEAKAEQLKGIGKA